VLVLVGKAGVHRKGDVAFEDVLKDVRGCARIHEAGAIVCFIGIVRRDRHRGSATDTLELEAWTERADAALLKICKEEEAVEGIVDVRIHHNVGVFSPGEDLVYVTVAGAHRQEVFDCLQRVVERYKHEAPIWKKEHLKSGESYWISGQIHTEEK
jgi:molybdopterin synthase catalytic subunit